MSPSGEFESTTFEIEPEIVNWLSVFEGILPRVLNFVEHHQLTLKGPRVR